MTEAFEHTYNNIQNVSEAQVQSLHEFDASVTELKDFTSSLLEGQADVRKTLENIIHRTEQLVNTMGAHHRTFKEIFGDDLPIQLSSISTYLEDLKKGFDHVGESIGTLPEALEVINQTQTEHRHLLADRFRELKEFNQTFSHHLKNHENEAANFTTQMRKTASTFEQMATKNSELIHDIHRMLDKVNQLFSQRDQQLDANVSSVKDALSNHVTYVENTLGQKLDTMIRTIDHSLYSL